MIFIDSTERLKDGQLGEVFALRDDNRLLVGFVRVDAWEELDMWMHQGWRCVRSSARWNVSEPRTHGSSQPSP